MPAYIIAFVEVTDRERYAEYMKFTPDIIAQFGGKFIARGGKTETLEGQEEKRRVVLIEFPNYEQARAFYRSEQYEETKKMRVGSFRSRFAVMTGTRAPERRRNLDSALRQIVSPSSRTAARSRSQRHRSTTTQSTCMLGKSSCQANVLHKPICASTAQGRRSISRNRWLGLQWERPPRAKPHCRAFG